MTEKSAYAHRAYLLLKIAFVAIPIIAGLDKFFHILEDWDHYVAPIVNQMIGGHGYVLMRIAGVIEIIAGIGVFFKPRIFANIVGLWLILIIVNLLMAHNFYDDVLRDSGLSLSAFALGRLAKIFD